MPTKAELILDKLATIRYGKQFTVRSEDIPLNGETDDVLEGAKCVNTKTARRKVTESTFIKIFNPAESGISPCETLPRCKYRMQCPAYLQNGGRKTKK